MVVRVGWGGVFIGETGFSGGLGWAGLVVGGMDDLWLA